MYPIAGGVTVVDEIDESGLNHYKLCTVPLMQDYIRIGLYCRDGGESE